MNSQIGGGLLPVEIEQFMKAMKGGASTPQDFVPQTSAKTAANNNKKNSNNDNIIQKLTEELNKQKQVVYGIKLNKKSLHLWILLLLSNILIIWSFVVTPIRYSNVRVLDLSNKSKSVEDNLESSIFSFNNVYYYLHMILLLILFLYGWSLNSRIPLIVNNPTYTTIGLLFVTVIGLFVINMTSSKPQIENGSYHSAPKHIYKTNNKMIIIHTLLLLLVSSIIGIEIYKKPKNPLGLHINLLGSTLIFVLIGSIYLLINSIKYYVKKYKLPKTWAR